MQRTDRYPPLDWNKENNMKKRNIIEVAKKQISSAFKDKGFNEPDMNFSEETGIIQITSKEKYWVENEKKEKILRSISTFSYLPGHGAYVNGSDGNKIKWTQKNEDEFINLMAESAALCAKEMVDILPENDKVPVN